jgi:DNA-binding phage protein
MTETELLWKLEEVDRLLNDLTTSMDAARIWSLTAEIARFAGMAGIADVAENGAATSSSEGDVIRRAAA